MNADCVSKSGSKSLRKIPLTNSWCQTIPVYQPNQAVFTFLQAVPKTLLDDRLIRDEDWQNIPDSTKVCG